MSSDGDDTLIFIDGIKLSELMIKHGLGIKYIDSLPVIDDEFYPIVK